MKKQILKSALIAMAGVGLLAGSAMALQMTITDGTIANTVTVYDGLAGDTLPGYVEYSSLNSVLFSEWQIVSAEGSSDPILDNGYLNLNSLDITGTSLSTGKTLTITLTDDYKGNFSGFTTEWSPSLNQGFSVDFYVTITDGANIWHSDWDNILTTGDFINTISTLSTSTDWTITQQLILTKSDDGVARFSLDATTSPVPEPGTMLLLGTGLAGLAAVGRRRKTQA